MLLALDGGRFGEAGVGIAVLLGLAVVCLLRLRAWRRRRHEPQLPTIAELVRFAPVIVSDPLLFGGGPVAAAQRQRHDTVAYGYLAIAEEFAPADGGATWCILTVSLPGQVPMLCVDRRPGAPPPGLVPVPTGDANFDATFVVSAHTPEVDVGALLVPHARDLLLRAPVQRLMLRDSELLVRTPDQTTLDAAVLTGLRRLVGEFLGATPSFVRRPAGLSGGGPLPPGLYGVDEADEKHRSSALS
jgi:hypothetical protein